MSEFRSHYVIIGGMATVLTLEKRGLPARATKDVDMIIICQPETKFYMKRFWEFVKAGGYKMWKPTRKKRRIHASTVSSSLKARITLPR
jgi:hypothetical protein